MTNKLAIIGGSGLYDVEEFKDREFLDVKTSWGNPSDKILKTKYKGKEVQVCKGKYGVYLKYDDKNVSLYETLEKDITEEKLGKLDF